VHIHHDVAVDGVDGSCHQLTLDDARVLLIGCGLFQGAEARPDDTRAGQPEIGFAVQPIAALIVTHLHIGHAGRLAYLLAAGYRGPILSSPASAVLLALMLEDALEVGFTLNRRLIESAWERRPRRDGTRASAPRMHA
jgi:metallo-beta-lactamase family protein